MNQMAIGIQEGVGAGIRMKDDTESVIAVVVIGGDRRKMAVLLDAASRSGVWMES